MKFVIVGGGTFVRVQIRDFKEKHKINNYILKEVPTSKTNSKFYWYKRTPRPATRQGKILGRDEMLKKYGPTFTMTNYYDKYLKDGPPDMPIHPLMQLIEDGKIEIGRKKKDSKMKETGLLYVADEDTVTHLLEEYPDLRAHPVIELSQNKEEW